MDRSDSTVETIFKQLRKERWCLSGMSGYLEKWLDRETDVRYICVLFHEYYQEFLDIHCRDAEKTSIQAFYESPKRFIENIPLIIKELEAVLAKKENKNKSLQEEKLKLLSKPRRIKRELYQVTRKKNEFAQQIEEEEEELNILIQGLIRLLEVIPKREIRRLKSEDDELIAKCLEEFTMAESNSTQKKSFDNVEKSTQGFLSRMLMKDVAENWDENWFLSQMNDCLEKWLNGQSDCSCVLGRFPDYYQEFLHIHHCDTKKMSISAIYTDPKRFIENIPSVIEELEAVLANKEIKIKWVKKVKLHLQELRLIDGIVDWMILEECVQQLEEVKTKIQILIQTFKDDFPERAILNDLHRRGQAKKQLEAKRDQLKADKDQFNAEKDQFIKENDQLKAEKTQLIAENNQLIAGTDQLRAENDQLKAERDQLRAENDQLKAERDQLRAEKDHLKEQVPARSVQITEDDDGKVVPSGQF